MALILLVLQLSQAMKRDARTMRRFLTPCHYAEVQNIGYHFMHEIWMQPLVLYMLR